MLEKDLYPHVERWVKHHYKCWATGINTGVRSGRIDVVGVRDVGGDLSGRSEVIAVEVKAGTQVFTTAAGQAHGYSVMADRCYLADKRSGSSPFDPAELRIAEKLGIGLLAIRGNNKTELILSAPPCDPIDELRLQVVEKLGLADCSLCGTLFRRGTCESPTSWTGVVRAVREQNDLAQAARQERGYMWWLTVAAEARDQKGRKQDYWRRYLCHDCAWALARREERAAP